MTANPSLASRLLPAIAAALGLAAALEAQTPDEQRIREIVEKILEEKKLEGGTTFRAYWKDGLEFETADGAFKAHVGGQLQTDWAFISEDRDIKAHIPAGATARLGEQENGVEIRRARLGITTTYLERWEFKLEYDFAEGDARVRDAYVALKEIPALGTVKVGHFKEPFSLEELTSIRFATFLERALPNALSPSRNMGVSIGNTAAGDRMTWALGAFRETDDFGRGADDGGFSFGGRLTGLPCANEENDHLLHLGAAVRVGDPLDDEVRFRQRPEIHLVDPFVDTGTFDADNTQRLGLETALVTGPFSLQGEFMAATADAPGENPEFYGWYAYASLFLTGEHRNYNRARGAFDRMRPKRNFLDGEGGAGAWELAARYSAIDFVDEGIDGGRLHDVTLGTNWYLNPITRVTVNVVFADLDDVGHATAAAMRFQVIF